MTEINNLTAVEVDEVLVKKVVDTVLKGEGAGAYPQPSRDVSIAFIGPGRMRKLNKTYREKNRVTDVLSFPESKVRFEKFKIGPAEETGGLGEIVICLREVFKNAKKNNITERQEVMRVIIHGVLHILGLDHEKSEAEAKRMESKEEEYLAKSKIQNTK